MSQSLGDDMTTVASPPLVRFEELCDPEPNSGCWLWTGARTRHGHGRFKDGTKLVDADRFAYLNYVGELSDNLVVGHKCETRSCVNPTHLEARAHSITPQARRANGHASDARSTTVTEGEQAVEPVSDSLGKTDTRRTNGHLRAGSEEPPDKAGASKLLMVLPWALFAATLGLAFAFYLVSEERERHYVERLRAAVARQEFLRETIYVLEPNKLKVHNAMLKAHVALKKNGE